MKSGKWNLIIGIVAFFLNAIGLLALVAMGITLVGLFRSGKKGLTAAGFILSTLGFILNLYQNGHLG